MTNFLFELPLWLLAVVLNIALMGFGLLALGAARRWFLPRLHLGYSDAYFGAAIVQSMMLLYSLIAALTAVGVWQRYSQVSDITSSEATAIASLWRDFGGYPEPQRGAMRDLLKGYTQQVINDAWPKQRRGEVPSEGVEWMDRLQAQLYSVEPTTEGLKILHAETLSGFNNLVQLRRQRLDSIDGGLPRVMWFVLMPGAFGCLLAFCFFHVDNRHFQTIMVIGLAGFLSMVLFVVIGLDRPFSGDMGIKTDSYQLVYDHHMK